MVFVSVCDRFCDVCMQRQFCIKRNECDQFGLREINGGCWFY